MQYRLKNNEQILRNVYMNLKKIKCYLIKRKYKH
jgi:hypothetical protein